MPFPPWQSLRETLPQLQSHLRSRGVSTVTIQPEVLKGRMEDGEEEGQVPGDRAGEGSNCCEGRRDGEGIEGEDEETVLDKLIGGEKIRDDR